MNSTKHRSATARSNPQLGSPFNYILRKIEEYNIYIFLSFSVFLIIYTYLILRIGVSKSPDAKNIFDWFGGLNERNGFNCRQYELLYCGLAISIKHFGFGASSFILICSFIFYINISISLYIIFIKFNKNHKVCVSFLVFLCLFVVVFFLKPETVAHLSRQYISLSFVVVSLFCKRTYCNILLVTAAALFHSVSILFVLITIIKMFNYKSEYESNFTARYIFIILLLMASIRFILDFGIYNMLTHGIELFDSLNYRYVYYRDNYNPEINVNPLKWVILVIINVFYVYKNKIRIYFYYSYAILFATIFNFDIPLVQERLYHSFKILSVVPLCYIYMDLVGKLMQKEVVKRAS